MCNLNIVIRKSDAPKKVIGAIPAFMMAVTSTSYQSNDDGDGLYCGGLLWKGKNKLDLFNIGAHLQKHNILISHQRVATSGFTTQFTQPFANKDFVLAHNGIISSFATEGKSDTYVFFHRFCEAFEKEMGGKKEDRREECIKKIIQELLGTTFGSYSIALFDKVTQRLYYFKNMGASINVYQSKHLLYLTTSHSNKDFLPMFSKEKFKELEVVGYVIYRIEADDLNMYEIGSIDAPKCEYERKGSLSNWFYKGWGLDYDKPTVDKMMSERDPITDDYFLQNEQSQKAKEKEGKYYYMFE